MEVEVKYALPSSQILKSIWTDPQIAELSDETTAESLPFAAYYYDTPAGDLRSRRFTLRARSEGSSAFATVKWDGSHDGPLSRRQEINVPVDAEHVSEAPSVELFKGSDAYEPMKELIGDQELIPAVKMFFTRSRKRLTYEGNLIELALDEGRIDTEYGSVPILEMELEHYAGPDEESVQKLGEIIARRWELEPELRSKYSRGIALIRANSRPEL